MTVAQLVGRERARLWLAIVFRGVAVAVSLAAVVVAASAIVLGDARWITRPGAPLLAWAVALGAALLALWWTRRELARTATPVEVARRIEEERRLRAGSLRGALEVAHAGALGRLAAETLAARLAGAGRVLAPGLQQRVRRRGVMAFLGATGGLVLLGAARGISPDGWRALSHPVGALTGTILQPLRIVDLPRYVMRGERLRVLVDAPDRRTLSLHVRLTGAPWETLALPVVRGSARTVLGPLDADLMLVASDGRMTSDTIVVRVTDRPFVGDVAIRAIYPSYLGRPAETIPLGEPARVPRGTVLAISGRASSELARVELRREGDTLRLAPDGHAFSGRLVAMESGRWTWFALSTQGPIADLPSPLDLDVVPDSAPRVEILAPEQDTVPLTAALVELRAAATDDHGLSSVVLRTQRRLANGKVMPEITQDLASPRGPQWEGAQTLDLSSRGLEPGDVVRLVVAATDNSPWRQTAESRELILRMPSLSEQRERARALADSTVARLSAAAKSERDLAERTGAAARSRTDRTSSGTESASSDGRTGDERRPAMSYQSAEEARALAREQQQLQQQVERAQRDARALEQQLRSAGVLDSALLQQIHEVQRLLADALTPELQQELRDVLDAAQRLSPEDLRRAMRELAEQQERLRRELERSAEMLRRAALEGAMQTLRDEAREIAQRERALADSLARPSAARDSTLARDAQSLSRRSRDLSRDIAELGKRLAQERADAGPARLKGAAERADSSASAMERVAPTGDRSGQREAGGRDAARAADQAAQQMERAAQQLGDAREAQIQEWKNQITGELDRSIQETMQLAREQASLAERARRGERDELRGDQSAVQQGVNRVQERLQRAAQRSTHVSPQSASALADAQRRVQEATQQVAESTSRDGQRTAAAMEEAAQALTRAAAQMMRDRTRASRAQSASGFAEMIEAMRKAAQEQGAINAQSAGLLPLPGGQPTAQMLAQARSLAKQQRDIADRVERAGEGAGSAEELAKEMRQIADALDRGRIDPGLLERQQRLYHRLLDAGLTLEKDEREDTGKREARTGADTAVIVREGPLSGRSAVRYREPTWNELRGLTADERRAVLEYFKRINAERP